MSPRLFTPALAALLTFAASSSVQAGFTWVADPNNPYTAGTIHQFTVASPGYASGITSDFSVNQDGTVGTNTLPTADSKKITFTTANDLVAGDMLEFCFDMSVVLASIEVTPGSGNFSTRLAAQFQHFGVVDPITGASTTGAPGMDVDVTFAGGNDTLANYFDYPNSIRTGSNGNGDWFVDNTDILASQGFNAAFNGVAGNTASYSTSAFGATDFAGFFIVDQDRDNEDLSFQKATYKVTLQGDLAAGSKFQWTFGGAEATIIDEPGEAIPEPSRAVLLGLGSLALLLRRRR